MDRKTMRDAPVACGRAAGDGRMPVEFATGFASRMRGLAGRPQFAGVLVLAPCCDVHTWGMGVPLDIAFADRRGRILQAQRAVPPRSRLRNGGAAFVIERVSCSEKPWFSLGDQVFLTSGRINHENMPHL